VGEHQLGGRNGPRIKIVARKVASICRSVIFLSFSSISFSHSFLLPVVMINISSKRANIKRSWRRQNKSKSAIYAASAGFLVLDPLLFVTLQLGGGRPTNTLFAHKTFKKNRKRKKKKKLIMDKTSQRAFVPSLFSFFAIGLHFLFYRRS
jgi:hypothetical protein